MALFSAILLTKQQLQCSSESRVFWVIQWAWTNLNVLFFGWVYGWIWHSIMHNWLVVWSILYFSMYWECHHPIWQTHIFQMGRYTTNQWLSWDVISDMGCKSRGNALIYIYMYIQIYVYIMHNITDNIFQRVWNHQPAIIIQWLAIINHY